MRRSALVALGSNLPPRRHTLRSALEALRDLSVDRRVEASAFYETEPVGMSAGARPVINAACRFVTRRTPVELLEALLTIERRHGRQRAERGPISFDRTLDLDLLLLGVETVDTEQLRLPHPRLADRAFVLVPACEVARDMLHPSLGRSLGELLADLPAGEVEQIRSGQVSVAAEETEHET